MWAPINPRAGRATALLITLAAARVSGTAELDESCVISILNRAVAVKPDGTWVLANVPTNLGRVRARATCVKNGVTRSGQSGLFTIPPNRVVTVADITFVEPVPIPMRLLSTVPVTTLGQVGATAQIRVEATYPGGAVADVTAASRGTNHRTSNAGIATVSPDGLVTAHASGTVVLTAINEGATGLLRLSVVLSGDTDGDGIPDDVELANGLNPNDPVDALEDWDYDGLINRDELAQGTEIRKADTDGDGLSDGREVALGTSPLVFDTDGDGLGDGLEIQTGSDPLDPNSYNLALALRSLEVQPLAITLVVNSIVGQASRQLRVTGHLIDDRTLDLTSSQRRTTYSSNDLTVANFGAGDGEVFAGNNGSAIITVANSGFSATVPVTVRSFTPAPLSVLAIPGYANTVDALGGYAYVAAGAAGLHVVDVSNPRAPSLVGTVDTPGTAIDVRVVGSLAYLADGTSGLHVIDVSNPTAPVILGTVDTPGIAQDLAVSGARVLVADGSAGLQVIDAANPAAPVILATVDTPGNARGVALLDNRAILADAPSFLRVVDLTTLGIVGSLSVGDARDLAIRGSYAYVATAFGGLRAVDLAIPTAPRLAGTVANFNPRDVAFNGRWALASDNLFQNAVPIVDAEILASPTFRAIINFSSSGLHRGLGIAADPRYVYVTADKSGPLPPDFSATGNTFLFIGQYLELSDDAGVPPTVTVTAPPEGATYFEGASLAVRAEATDDVGVSAVTFLLEGAPYCVDGAPPYECPLEIPLGLTSLRLGALATDFGGNAGVATEVTVAIVPDPPPTLAFVTPPPDAEPMEDAFVSWEAAASDNVAVQRVRLFVDGSPVGSDQTPPYAGSFRVPTGRASIDLVAEAADNLGRVATVSRTLTVTPDPPPVVAILSPAPGTTLLEASTVTVYASATDNVAVQQVRFLVDGTPVVTVLQPPYQVTLTIPLDATSTTFTAEATDNLGRTTVTAGTYPVVPDPPPVVFLSSPATGTVLAPGATIVLSAQASDNVRVQQVQFTAAGRTEVDFTAPYQMLVRVPLSGTTFPVVVQATDNLGRTSETSYEFTVGMVPAELVVEPTYLSFRLPAQRIATLLPEGGTNDVRTAGGPVPERESATEASPATAAPSEPPTPGSVADRLPLHFEANGRGFHTQGRGFALQLDAETVGIHLRGPGASPTRERVSLRFAGARPSRLVGADRLPGESHYLIGRNPSRWLTHVPQYGRVRYESAWPGVDVEFYGRGPEVEYDVIVAPGADPQRIRLSYGGVKRLSVDDDGAIQLETRHGRFQQLAPLAYQEIGGTRQRVEAAYALVGKHDVGFRLGPYDESRPLYIDPIVRFASYWGGTGYEDGTRIALGVDGSIYLAGSTTSRDFPTAAGRQIVHGGGSYDAYVTKLSPDGASVVYSTYLGSEGDDNASALEVAADGSVLVAGRTSSGGFPIVGGVRNQLAGATDAFVSRISPDGSSLTFSTYLGGFGIDEAKGVATTPSGEILVAGTTHSSNFPVIAPTRLCGQASYVSGDGFLSRLSAAGSALTFSTCVGGNGDDSLQALATDAQGRVYLAGYTRSTDLPQKSPIQPYRGYYDSFVTKLAADARTLIYSTYLGGSQDDFLRDIAVDPAGGIAVTGYTSSTDFPTAAPLQPAHGGSFDWFITRLTADGVLSRSTFIGGPSYDAAYGIAVGSDDAVFVTGLGVTGFPVVNAMRTGVGYQDAVVAKVRPTGELEHATSIADGNSYQWSQGTDLAVGVTGDVHIVGIAGGAAISPVGAPQPVAGGGIDAFVMRLGQADNVQVGESEFVVYEGWSQVEVTLIRSDAGDVPVTVAYSTLDETAQAPFDYQAVSGTVTFGPGETSRSFSIPIADDPLVEAGETLFVSLALVEPSNGVVLGNRATAVVRIENDDYPAEPGTETQAFVVRDRTRGEGPPWEAVVSVPWLSLSSDTGQGPSTVYATADTAGLPIGTHTGTITVTAAAEGSPQVIDVSLTVGTPLQVGPAQLRLSASDPALSSAIEPAAGGGDMEGEGVPAIGSSLAAPRAMVLGSDGTVYVADTGHFRIRKITPDGLIYTIAGTGVPGYSGDGGPATAAEIGECHGLALSASGELYFSDRANHVVRRIDSAGNVSTVAGIGLSGFEGDDGPAVQALLDEPTGIAIDATGRLWIADTDNHRIRRVEAEGTIVTAVGNGGPYYGDGPALDSYLNHPVGLAIASTGDVFFVEEGNHMVRRLAEGQVTTVAGGRLNCGSPDPVSGRGNDGEAALGSALSEPRSIAIDGLGNLYIADSGNHRVRRVSGERVDALAGTGEAGDTEDGGPATAAQLDEPSAVATDAAGNVWIADTRNHRIRKVARDPRYLIRTVSISAYDENTGANWPVGYWVASSSVPWLTITPSESDGGGTFTAVADLAGLAPGPHGATIGVATDDGLVQREVVVDVVVPVPNVRMAPEQLLFTLDEWEETTVRQVEIFDAANPAGPLDWELVLPDDAPWLSVSQASGDGPTTVELHVESGDLNDGSHRTDVILKVQGVPSRTLPVSLRIDSCEGG